MKLERHIPKRPPLSLFVRMTLLSLRDIFTPLSKPTREKLEIRPDELRVWMIGHATVLINFFGQVVLTDPVLSSWLPFPRRLVAAAYSADELPPIDYLLISHAHLDHCHLKSLKRLSPKVSTAVLPQNCSDLVRGMGYRRVIELQPGETHLGDVTIKALKVEHWGLRYPWERIPRGYNGYLLERKGKSVFFAGDTGYGKFFQELGIKYQVDCALLPISAYNPPMFREYHLHPGDAIRAFEDLRARHLIPIHWGNFRLSMEPMSEPINLLTHLVQKEGIESRVHILQNGESFKV